MKGSRNKRVALHTTLDTSRQLFRRWYILTVLTSHICKKRAETFAQRRDELYKYKPNYLIIWPSDCTTRENFDGRGNCYHENARQSDSQVILAMSWWSLPSTESVRRFRRKSPRKRLPWSQASAAPRARHPQRLSWENRRMNGHWELDEVVNILLCSIWGVNFPHWCLGAIHLDKTAS